MVARQIMLRKQHPHGDEFENIATIDFISFIQFFSRLHNRAAVIQYVNLFAFGICFQIILSLEKCEYVDLL